MGIRCLRVMVPSRSSLPTGSRFNLAVGSESRLQIRARKGGSVSRRRREDRGREPESVLRMRAKLQH